MELTDPLILKYRDLLLEKGLVELAEGLAPDRTVMDLIASMAGSSVAEALERLAKYIENKLDKRIAALAYAEVTGVYDEELSVKSLAKHLAMWYLSIAQDLGLIKLG